MLFKGSNINSYCLQVNWNTCYVQHVFPFQREGTCDWSLPAGHFGSVVCLFIHEWVCVWVCVSSLGLMNRHTIFTNVSVFALVHPARVTICGLFVSVCVPEIPEIPTIHHSSHQAGGISSFAVTAKAECSPLKPEAAERQSIATCVSIFFNHFTLLSLRFHSVVGTFCGGF